MKKKLIFVVILIFSFLLFETFTAVAADKGAFVGIIDAIDHFGLKDGAAKLMSGGELNDIGKGFVRFCLGTVIFSLFFWVLSKKFGDNRNIAVAIAFISALICAFATPDIWVVNMFKVMGWIGPLIVYMTLVFIGYKAQESVKDSPFLVGIIMIITALTLFALTRVLEGFIEIIAPSYGWLTGVLYTATFFYIFAGIFKMFSGAKGISGVAHDAGQGVGETARSPYDALKGAKDGIMGKGKEGEEEKEETEQEKKLSRTEQKYIEALRKISHKGLKNIEEIIVQLGKIIEVLKSKFFKDEVKEQLSKALGRIYDTTRADREREEIEKNITDKIARLISPDYNHLTKPRNTKLATRLEAVGNAKKLGSGTAKALIPAEVQKLKWYSKHMKDWINEEITKFNDYKVILSDILTKENQFIEALNLGTRDVQNDNPSGAVVYFKEAIEIKQKQKDDYKKIEDILRKLDLLLAHRLKDLSNESNLLAVIQATLRQADETAIKNSVRGY